MTEYVIDELLSLLRREQSLRSCVNLTDAEVLKTTVNTVQIQINLFYSDSLADK